MSEIGHCILLAVKTEVIMKMFKNLTASKIFQLLFFGIMILLGLSIYKDYGMSWDENFQRNENGKIVYEYIFKNAKSEYFNAGEKYHGPALEFVLYSMERLFNLDDTRTIYLMRHLVCYLIYLFSALMLFKLIEEIYQNWKLAAFACIVYTLSPRLFAESFYNSKDVGDLSIFTIAICSGYRFIMDTSWRKAMIHGLVSGFLIAIRITGIIMPAITLFVLALYSINMRKETSIKYNTINGLLYLGFTVGFAILFWPIMWHHPIDNFSSAWKEMSQFDWKSHVTYLGEFVNTWELPWHYLPVWIGLTTPILILILLFLSVIAIAVNTFFLKRIDHKKYFLTIFAFLLFVAPISSVVFLHSIVYDGWRHLYFIYGSMIVAIVYPIYLLENRVGKKIGNYLHSLLLIGYVPVILMMIKLHPFQNLYFNKLFYPSLADARFNMEMDYWGLTYSKGLKYIVDNDKAKTVNVKVDNFGGNINLLLLAKEERDRINFVTEDSLANYFVGNYRWCRSEYPYPNECYNVTVDGAKVMAVYKLK